MFSGHLASSCFLPVRERGPSRYKMDPIDHMMLLLYVLHLQLVLVRVRLALRHHNQALQGRRDRGWFYRDWLGLERRWNHGLYNQLMTELRAEDPESFTNFMRMPPEMFDELLDRITTNFCSPIEPG